MRRLLQLVHWLFSTWRFAVFAIGTLGLTVLFLLAILLWPADTGAVGAFAEDFKIWCFGYDPATGELEWGYVFLFIAQPTVLALVTAAVWASPLREALSAPRALVPWLGAATGFTALTVLSMVALQPTTVSAGEGELPFPADALRTEIPVQSFTLTGHDGAPVELSALRGQVVLITAIYATCGDTCPMIFAQARGALAELSPDERSRVSVLAITLDPTRDTPDALGRIVAAQQLPSPPWRLLSGEPALVESTLKRLGFTWTRDPQTGVISHPNLFLLVDAQGRLAYRFTLGDQQQRWLVSGLRALIAELRPA